MIVNYIFKVAFKGENGISEKSKCLPEVFLVTKRGRVNIQNSKQRTMSRRSVLPYAYNTDVPVYRRDLLQLPDFPDTVYMVISESSNDHIYKGFPNYPRHFHAHLHADEHGSD